MQEQVCQFLTAAPTQQLLFKIYFIQTWTSYEYPGSISKFPFTI
jgi:hypothetical protein